MRDGSRRMRHDVCPNTPKCSKPDCEALVIRLLLRTVLALLGNALGLWIASLVLDDMSISGAAFVLAVVIFTVLTAVLQPLITKIAVQNAPALQGSSALVTTLVALVITDLVSDGLSISGAVTWVLATIIVWLATMIAAVLLPMFLFKELLENRKD
jgi:putative membrane protein